MAEGVVLVDTATTIGDYDVPPTPALRRPRAPAHRHPHTERHDHLLPLQGDGDILVGRRRWKDVADVAWSYEVPDSECRAIRSHVCFDKDKVDVQADLPAWPARTGAVDK